MSGSDTLPDLFGGSASAESEQDLDAVIYARTSSPSQEHGYSIDAQVSRCWDRCERMGWRVTHVFADRAVSGEDRDRRMFQEMLTRAEAQSFDVVTFWKLDRFSRSLMHAVQLEKQLRDWGVALHSVTEQIDTTTPTGRFNFRNISSASEFERELIRQRSQLGMHELAREHKWPNKQPPIGYTMCDDGTLEVDEPEAETVRLIFQKYIKFRSMPEVADLLNERGISTKDGGEWTARGVGDVLKNELYTGTYDVADVNEYVSEYQLLSDELFDEVTEIRTRFSRDEPASRGQMQKSRKKKYVRTIVDQYTKYLAQVDT